MTINIDLTIDLKGQSLIQAVKDEDLSKITDLFNSTPSLGIYETEAKLEACKMGRLDLMSAIDTHDEPSPPAYYGLHLIRLERELRKDSRAEEFQNAIIPILNRDPHAGGNSAMQLAVLADHLPALNQLIAENDFDENDCNQALVSTTLLNRLNMIAPLLKTGKIEPHTFNKTIMNLIANGHTEKVIQLMRNKDISDFMRSDFVCKAAETGNRELSIFFLNQGPICNWAWEKAFKKAKAAGHHEIAALFTPLQKIRRIAVRFLSDSINVIANPLGEFGADFLARGANFLARRTLISYIR